MKFPLSFQVSCERRFRPRQLRFPDVLLLPDRLFAAHASCLIAGIRLARKRQVNIRVVPTREAIEESVDLAHGIFNRIFRKVPAEVREIHSIPTRDMQAWYEANPQAASPDQSLSSPPACHFASAVGISGAVGAVSDEPYLGEPTGPSVG